MREFAVHRSGYQLKEADPHSWAIPRLSGRAKSALIEIQYDEYGQGGRAGPLRALLRHDGRGGSTGPTAPLWTGCPGRRWRRRTWCPSSVPPALARSARRAPGAVRDDLGGADGPLSPGRGAVRSVGGRPALLRRARDCGCPPRDRGGHRSRRWPGGGRTRLATTSSSGPGPSWPSRSTSPTICSARGRRGSARCAHRCDRRAARTGRRPSRPATSCR